MQLLVGYFDYKHFLYILEALRASRSNDACVVGILTAVQQYLINCYRRAGIKPYSSPEGMSITRMFKDLLEVIEEFSNSFRFLKEEIDLKLQKYKRKIKPIKFSLFPMIGIVICPDMRYVAVLESDYNIKSDFTDTAKWFFKRIHISK